MQCSLKTQVLIKIFTFIFQFREAMDSKRQHKYSRLILKDLAEIFQHDYRDSFNPAFVTLTDVTITPDLGIASVYVSVLPIAEKERVLDSLEQKKSHIRGALGRRIGKQARIIPELRFFIDETEEKAAHMDALFKDLDIPPTSDDSNIED